MTAPVLGAGGTELQDVLDEGGRHLINNYWFWYAGLPGLPWRFGELKISIGIMHYSDQLNHLSRGDVIEWLKQKRPSDKIMDAFKNNGIPLIQDEWRYLAKNLKEDFSGLPNTAALRYQSRPLKDDEIWLISPDGKTRIAAKESDSVIIPLSRQRCLVIGFGMLCANEPPVRWRLRGVEVIEAILQGMRFDGPWPGFEDAPANGSPLNTEPVLGRSVPEYPDSAL